MTPTLPASAYVDPGVYAAELARLFRRGWQVAAASATVPRPGDAFATSVADVPVLLVRADDGVRAFHNACRHRYAPLVWEGERACGKQLHCRYHGWRYGLDGALLGTGGFGGEVDGRGLVPIRCGVWRGIVFVDLAGDAGPLSAAIGGLDAASAHVGFEGFEVERHARHPLACNWKTYVENYLEGWHIPYLHPDLVAAIDVAAYDVRAGDTFCTHHAPPRDGAPTDGFWAWLWPNTAINVYPGGMSLERIVPTGPQTMVIDYTYLFAPDVPREARDAAMVASLTLTHEDRQVVEAVQRALAAAPFPTGLVSPRHEGGLARFYELWNAGMA